MPGYSYYCITPLFSVHTTLRHVPVETFTTAPLCGKILDPLVSLVVDDVARPDGIPSRGPHAFVAGLHDVHGT